MDWVRYLEWRLYLRWLHWCGHQYITFCGNLCIPTKTVKSKPCFDSTILQKIELRIWRTNLGMLTALRTSKSSMISRTLLKKINQITGVNLSKIWILRTVDNCGLAWTSLLTKPAATLSTHPIQLCQTNWTCTVWRPLASRATPGWRGW